MNRSRKENHLLFLFFPPFQKKQVFSLSYTHIHTTILLAIHYILSRELKLNYPQRITKCKINSGLNEVHMAMENYLWAIPSEMCISNLIPIVFREEIKSLVSHAYCTFFHPNLNIRQHLNFLIELSISLHCLLFLSHTFKHTKN